MKLSAVVKKLGLMLCILGAISLIFVLAQLIDFASTPDPVSLGILWYSNLACVFVLPMIGSSLMRWSVLLMLQCR